MVEACLLGAAIVVHPCLLQAYHATKDGSRRIQEALTTDDIRYISWRIEKYQAELGDHDWTVSQCHHMCSIMRILQG
jgi:hypothetical protein